jgi:hypothetical protein
MVLDRYHLVMIFMQGPGRQLRERVICLDLSQKVEADRLVGIQDTTLAAESDLGLGRLRELISRGSLFEPAAAEILKKLSANFHRTSHGWHVKIHHLQTQPGLDSGGPRMVGGGLPGSRR